MTVGELKKLLEDVPDEHLVKCWDTHEVEIDDACLILGPNVLNRSGQFIIGNGQDIMDLHNTITRNNTLTTSECVLKLVSE